MKRDYEYFQILIMISCLSWVLSCGRVNALPQDWPCEKITLQKAEKADNDGKATFKGDNGSYQIIVNSFDDNIDNPYIYNCGNAGCWGKMMNLQTGKSEIMRFDCSLNAYNQSLTCERISGDEYILSKFSDNEYRVNLCGEFYRYISLHECSKCTCTLHDSRGSNYLNNYEMNCGREDEEHIHCYLRESYNWTHKYDNEDDNYENCVGLSL